MPTKMRAGRRPSRLTEDMAMHLTLGWCLDTVVRWHKELDFPFRDEEHRKEVWIEHRDFLVSRYGPLQTIAAWRDYEAEPTEAAAFNRPVSPWGWGEDFGDG